MVRSNGPALHKLRDAESNGQGCGHSRPVGQGKLLVGHGRGCVAIKVVHERVLGKDGVSRGFIGGERKTALHSSRHTSLDPVSLT